MRSRDADVQELNRQIGLMAVTIAVLMGRSKNKTIPSYKWDEMVDRQPQVWLDGGENGAKVVHVRYHDDG